MMRFRYGVALTAACAALLLSGCGGSGSTVSTEGIAPAARQNSTPQAREEANKAVTQDSDGKTITSDVKVTQQTRSIIYVSSMTVRAKDVTVAADKAKTIVTGAGGYLANEKSSAPESGEGEATLEFKIPPDRYPATLASLGKDLGKRLSLTQGTTDVTLQVADVESRLKSAEQALASLRTLMTKAKTIGQVLEVEREISGREAELESLQAQQKELASQVGMATLTLQIIGPVAVAPEPEEEEPAGFLGGLKAGWEALLSFLKIALTVIGALLPWMLIIAPVIALMVYLVRRGRTSRPMPPHGGGQHQPPGPWPLPGQPFGAQATEPQPEPQPEEPEKSGVPG